MSKTPLHNCPVCQHQSPGEKTIPACRGGRVIEQRLNVPTLQNVTLATRETAKTVRCGALKMVQCGDCGFVWNAAFDPELICYDSSYNNDVIGSRFYQAHLCEMADRILASVPAGTDIHYVEIGCGEGDFLRLLHERGKGRIASAVGFDPAFTAHDKLPENAVVHPCCFTPAEIEKIPSQANVVCSRHTIEHVSDVHSFAANLAAAMAPGRQLFVETPDVDWILRNGAFQDFFYEHCALYNPYSISLLLSQYGLQSEVTPVYNGQYMWVQAQMLSETLPVASLPLTEDPWDLGQAYQAHRAELLDSWSSFLAGRKHKGPIAVWGAASKGVTFSLIMNSHEHQMIEVSIDLNQAKQGCYLPVTGTPVVSPEAARQLGVTTIVIMNPNYEAEIRNMIAEMGWDTEVTVLNENTSSLELVWPAGL